MSALETKYYKDNSKSVCITRRFWISFMFSVPVFIIAMINNFASEYLPVSLSMFDIQWILFVLSTPVVLWGGWPFFLKVWHSITVWKLDISGLISIGILSAWIYSTVAMFFPQIFPSLMQTSEGFVYDYFEVSAIITTLLLLDKLPVQPKS